jgi:hypothetical protein
MVDWPQMSHGFNWRFSTYKSRHLLSN